MQGRCWDTGFETSWACLTWALRCVLWMSCSRLRTPWAACRSWAAADRGKQRRGFSTYGLQRRVPSHRALPYCCVITSSFRASICCPRGALLSTAGLPWQCAYPYSVVDNHCYGLDSLPRQLVTPTDSHLHLLLEYCACILHQSALLLPESVNLLL